MKVPEIPSNEHDRLETLRSLRLLDSPSEERFDRLTRMAQRLFGVPIALVSLVDENRQWFKSCLGLSARETSRDISFCGHTILGDDLLVIPDATLDDRFSDNPLVLNNPHIRFYAGCPIKAPNGMKLGTLCIIDDRPRNFGRDDLVALSDLAAMVECEVAAVQLATVDDLTAILNRRGFMMLAQHSLYHLSRENLSASLVFVDLDGLKSINDTYGHAAGDCALRDFAKQMKLVCRRDRDVVARLGGDEFAMLLNDTSKAKAIQLVADLEVLIAADNQASGRPFNISFSHGIVEFDSDRHHTIAAMLDDGDMLMYELKRLKRSTSS